MHKSSPSYRISRRRSKDGSSSRRRRNRSSSSRRSRDRNSSRDHRMRDRSSSYGGDNDDDDRSPRHSKSKNFNFRPKMKSKEAIKGIRAAKSKMRSELDSAKSELLDLKEIAKSNIKYDLPITITRQREIELIEDDNFRSSNFISSAGGAGGRIRNEDCDGHGTAIGKKEDAHDKAMFGPKWRDSIALKERSKEDEEIMEYSKPKEIRLEHPRFSLDPAERREKWLKILRELRANLAR